MLMLGQRVLNGICTLSAARRRPEMTDSGRRSGRQHQRAAIYTRISSDDGTALGVKRQEEDCRELGG